MKGIPLQERKRLSKEVERLGQMAVIRQLPQFQTVEVHNLVEPSAPQERLKVAAFNMERGVYLEETVEFLTACPDLIGVDVILGNELDDGNVRSGQRDTAKEIAQRLCMNYVFGLEFIELGDDANEKGYHGNAIFSRWPILRAESFYPDEGYNWFYSEQPRIGARVAILAELDVAGSRVGVVTAHLENRTSPEGRTRQMHQLLEHIRQFFPENEPVFLGGDFNTFTYADEVEGCGAYLDALAAGEKLPDLFDGEPLLREIMAEGFDLEGANDKDVSTCRDYYRPYEQEIDAKVDWLAPRHLTPMAYGSVSTLTQDCLWAPEGGVLRRFEQKQLSDHDAIWVETNWPQ